MAGTSASGGRNRKSRAEHALTGTGRKDRGTAATSSTSADVADPPLGQPRTPSWLTGLALVEWKRMVVRLEASKTLSTVDDAALYQYCALFAETEQVMAVRQGNAALIVALQRSIDKWTRMVDRLDVDEGADVAQRIGDQIVAAAEHIVELKKLEMKLTTQLRQGHMAVRQYLVEFGMTPAARTRVQPSPTDPAAAVNPLDRFTKTRP